MDFDETRLYYTYQQLQRDNDANEDNANAEESQQDDSGREGENKVNLDAVRRHFREFLRKYWNGFKEFRWIGTFRSTIFTFKIWYSLLTCR